MSESQHLYNNYFYALLSFFLIGKKQPMLGCFAFRSSALSNKV